MMHIWQVQEAKAKLTQLLNEAKKEPQIISRRGINETVVMSIEKYQALLGKQESLVSFLQSSPLHGVDLNIERDKSVDREIDL